MLVLRARVSCFDAENRAGVGAFFESQLDGPVGGGDAFECSYHKTRAQIGNAVCLHK